MTRSRSRIRLLQPVQRGGVGAVFAERQVVLGRTAVVAVSADDDFDGRMSREVGSGLGY